MQGVQLQETADVGQCDGIVIAQNPSLVRYQRFQENLTFSGHIPVKRCQSRHAILRGGILVTENTARSLYCLFEQIFPVRNLPPQQVHIGQTIHGRHGVRMILTLVNAPQLNRKLQLHFRGLQHPETLVSTGYGFP